jgi:hypothetical protein
VGAGKVYGMDVVEARSPQQGLFLCRDQVGAFLVLTSPYFCFADAGKV